MTSIALFEASSLAFCHSFWCFLGIYSLSIFNHLLRHSLSLCQCAHQMDANPWKSSKNHDTFNYTSRKCNDFAKLEIIERILLFSWYSFLFSPKKLRGVANSIIVYFDDADDRPMNDDGRLSFSSASHSCTSNGLWFVYVFVKKNGLFNRIVWTLYDVETCSFRIKRNPFLGVIIPFICISFVLFEEYCG